MREFCAFLMFVSDRGDSPLEVPIVNGHVSYRVDAGLPEIASAAEHQHEKLLYVLPEVGFLEAQPQAYWIMVTGVTSQNLFLYYPVSRTAFPDSSRSSGRQSSAFVEDGTEFRSFSTHEMRVGGEAGVFANLLIGAKVCDTVFLERRRMMLNFAVVGGTDEYWRDGLETTISFKEKFSTSDMEVLSALTGMYISVLP